MSSDYVEFRNRVLRAIVDNKAVEVCVLERMADWDDGELKAAAERQEYSDDSTWLLATPESILRLLSSNLKFVWREAELKYVIETKSVQLPSLPITLQDVLERAPKSNSHTSLIIHVADPASDPEYRKITISDRNLLPIVRRAIESGLCYWTSYEADARVHAMLEPPVKKLVTSAEYHDIIALLDAGTYELKKAD